MHDQLEQENAQGTMPGRMGDGRTLSGPLPTLPTPGRLIGNSGPTNDGYIRHQKIVLNVVLNFRAPSGLDRFTRAESKKSPCVPRLGAPVGHAMAMHWPRQLPGIEFGVRSEHWTSPDPCGVHLQLVFKAQLGQYFKARFDGYIRQNQNKG